MSPVLSCKLILTNCYMYIWMESWLHCSLRSIEPINSMLSTSEINLSSILKRASMECSKLLCYSGRTSMDSLSTPWVSHPIPMTIVWSTRNEAELVGVNDAMGLIIWTCMFLEAQGFHICDNIIHQDNESTMLLDNNGQLSSMKNTCHIDILILLYH